MNWNRSNLLSYGALGLLVLAGAGGLFFWFTRSGQELPMRVPGTDRAGGAGAQGSTNAVLEGKLIAGQAKPGAIHGHWPQFRGPERSGISPEKLPLARSWTQPGPKEIWGLDVGEGYAGAAVSGGRVYLMDYDHQKKQDALRCLSFDDGQEIWRYAYPVPVKRNHGMSRTVPAVSNGTLVALGPKCHVLALEAETGALRWGTDLVHQFGATIPPWYAGQCPLIEGDRVILAPGGKDALLVALELATGKLLWKTPNPHGWKMTHVSIVSAVLADTPTYIYCADKGVVGVEAATGRILWETTDWKISIATVPSPLVIDESRIFFSGGYDAGAMMLGLSRTNEAFKPEVLFRTSPKAFGATQQTPILFENHIYGVRPDGKFACLNLEGKPVWTSDGKSFGLGPFILAGGAFYAVNDSGLLRVIEANAQSYKMHGQAQILNGREAWAPLAITAGRLLARDLTRLVCLDLKPE